MNLENWNANANANNNNKGQNQQFKIYRLKKKWKMNNTISFKHGMFGLVWFGPQKTKHKNKLVKDWWDGCYLVLISQKNTAA